MGPKDTTRVLVLVCCFTRVIDYVQLTFPSIGADSHSPSNPPTGDNGGVEQRYMPELQFARCMSNRYRNEEFPRCVSCTRRWAGDTCRFQGIRFFMRDAQKKLVGISFQEHHSVGQAPVMEFPSKWNRSFEPEYVKRSKVSAWLSSTPYSISD